MVSKSHDARHEMPADPRKLTRIDLQRPLPVQLPDARDRLHCRIRLGGVSIALAPALGPAGLDVDCVSRGFNNTMDKVWDSYNRGRQWKDIRHKFVEAAEDEDDE
ncbi:Cytochrome b-c1 complex subunit 9, mitochondrial [Neonectria punicea]|uniref:Complex III subunit 9 n=1 Tax=Neonectria punicea TaxID=979145 RepID=A0ABR1GV04_9HYPO